MAYIAETPAMVPIDKVLGRWLDVWKNDFFQTFHVLSSRGHSGMLVRMHEVCLGRRTEKVENLLQHHVWVTDRWTVRVSEGNGILFEVPEEADEDAALRAWNEYKLRMEIGVDD